MYKVYEQCAEVNASCVCSSVFGCVDSFVCCCCFCVAPRVHFKIMNSTNEEVDSRTQKGSTAKYNRKTYRFQHILLLSFAKRWKEREKKKTFQIIPLQANKRTIDRTILTEFSHSVGEIEMQPKSLKTAVMSFNV